MSDRSDDLFSISHGDFSRADRALVWAEAERRERSGEPWSAVVEDFHRSGYWGYSLLPKGHPSLKAMPTAEETAAKDVRAFFLTAVQSLLILKAFVLYFGLNYAIHHDDADASFYAWGLGISVFVSFGSLLFFAIRKSRSSGFS